MPVDHVNSAGLTDLAVGVAPHLDDVLGVRVPALNAFEGVADLLAGLVDAALVLEHLRGGLHLSRGQHLAAHHAVDDRRLAVGAHGVEGVEHVGLAQLAWVVHASQRLSLLPQLLVRFWVEQRPQLVVLASAQLACHALEVVVGQSVGRRHDHLRCHGRTRLNAGPGLNGLVDALNHRQPGALLQCHQLLVAELLERLAQRRALGQLRVVSPVVDRWIGLWQLSRLRLAKVINGGVVDRWGRASLGSGRRWSAKPLLHGRVGLLKGRPWGRCRLRWLLHLRGKVVPAGLVFLQHAHCFLLAALLHFALRGSMSAHVASDVAEPGNSRACARAKRKACSRVGEQRLKGCVHHVVLADIHSARELQQVGDVAAGVVVQKGAQRFVDRKSGAAAQAHPDSSRRLGRAKTR